MSELVVLIVEDEALAARRNQRLLGLVLQDRRHRLHMATRLEEARDLLERNEIDLLFLDLNLKGKDGFRLLAEAAAGAFETIVISANTDRALEAFEYGVLDFIAKPYGKERLEKALRRFWDARGARRANPAKRLAIKQYGKIALLPMEEVLAVHGAGNYSEIETRDGRRLLHNKSLDQLAAILPFDFQRIHRSHIVDWREAVRLVARTGSRYFVVLADGRELPVGRGRVESLRELLV